MMKCNRNPDILHTFNQLSVILNQTFQSNKNKQIEFNECEKFIIDILGKNWTDNCVDILYFYKVHKYINIHQNEKGLIHSISFLNEIPIYQNFNDEICDFCYTKYLS